MRVSVIIPNFNYGDYIESAIQSVLDQSEPVDEIIVVDDGSTDHSRSVIEKFDGQVIPIFQQNAGQAAAISAGFAKATGDIICLLDSDDFFAPDKIQIIKKLYAENPDIDWIFHDLLEIEGKYSPTMDEVGIHAQAIKQIDERQAIRHGRIGYDAPATSGLTFRRSFIAALFPLPVAQSIYISDHYIKFYCLAMRAGVHLSQKLGGQLIHGQNLYTGQKKMATKGKIFVNTAMALRQICPETALFCNNLISEGKANALATRSYDQVRDIAVRYSEELSPFEMLMIDGKALIKSILYRRQAKAA